MSHISHFVMAGALWGVVLSFAITGLFGLGAVTSATAYIVYELIRHYEDVIKTTYDELKKGEGWGVYPNTKPDLFLAIWLAGFVAGFSILFSLFIGFLVEFAGCIVSEDCWRVSSSRGGEIQVPLVTRLFIGALQGAVTGVLLWVLWSKRHEEKDVNNFWHGY